MGQLYDAGMVPLGAVARRDNWKGGGCIFIYSCSHTVKTIAFKEIRRAPIIGLATALVPLGDRDERFH
jgi:hypothetical protein